MKKIISILLMMLLLGAFAVPAMAANVAIIFTANSGFTVGSTVTVNQAETQQKIMDLTNDVNVYEAAMAGNMQYYWFRNDCYYADGPSITLTEKDKACQFFCRVYLFNDADRIQQCGVYDSTKFSVPNTSGKPTIPTITTNHIPDGKVGESYYQKLECTDPDVVYSLFRSSLPDGLYLTQHGEIEGTPTKAGFWHVVIMATPEAGDDYATTKEYDITIEEEKEQYTLELMDGPAKYTYTLGETFDPAGMWVRIYTPDGYLDSRNGDKLTYYQEPLLNTGDRKIKLSYGDSFTFVYITVEAPKEPIVQLLEAPNKVEYNSGETLDLTGLKVRVIKTDGTWFDSQNGDQLKITTRPLVTVGEQKIKVAYGDSFDIFIVTVRKAPVVPPSSAPTTSSEPSNPDDTTTSTVPSTPSDTTTSTVPSTPSDTTTSTIPSTPSDTTTSTESVTDSNDWDDGRNNKNMPWVGTALISLGAAGAGGAVVSFFPRFRKRR